MTFFNILPRFGTRKKLEFPLASPKTPRFVQKCPVARRYANLLRPLAWNHFPERNLDDRRGRPAVSYAAFSAAMLIKLDQGLCYMSDLRQYLDDHPALLWLLGFQTTHLRQFGWRTQFQTPLPSSRHFTRLLRTIPNDALQFLLGDTVHLLQAELASIAPDFGQTISLDTKHIIAWVKENNSKAYVKERYNPKRQPKGDPDCRLGAKRRRNLGASANNSPPTPNNNPVPARSVTVTEFYWGYASGVVAAKVPGQGEFVLAELTQPFNKGDVTYFFPLMDDTERRLGFRPHFGAFDCAFDAFYIYEHFHSDQHDGFAAVPLAEKGGYKERFFDPDGLPLCQAGLAMPLKFTFTDRTRVIIEHERGKYVCPLLFPEPNGETCPTKQERWKHGGCTADMPTSIGARIRYQLDRDCDAYKATYNQRTATERINSLAVELGIERPKLRNQQAITNQNTLIYVLLNLRALHRIRSRNQPGA